MPRYKLTAAREAKELAKVELAEKLGCEYKSVIKWEKGTQTPNTKMRRKIREVLENNDPDLFTNFDETQEPESCVNEAVSGTVDSSDSHILDVPESEEEIIDMDKGRRKINETIASGIIAASGITLVNNIQVITGPAVEHDAYIDAVEGNIGKWWQWLNTGNDSELEAKLNIHVPVLRQIATSNSSYQHQAASLAVEAKIMQIFLANNNLQFAQRESHCKDAVKMGALSGDRNLLALAQFWYGDTFTYCYNRPETAIELLNNALSNVSNVDGNPLIAVKIYSDLSIAHAQQKNETKALEYVKLAYSTMPSNPALDNRLYAVGHAELDQLIGKSYLYLAEYLPDKYAQKAYDAFNKATSKQASTRGYRIQALIRKADAARVLDEKNECVNSLTDCLVLVPSAHRITQISDVLHRVPDEWKRETAITELQKKVSNALVVACQ